MHLATSLNERSLHLAQQMALDAALLRLDCHQSPGQAQIIDCGVKAQGSLAAGLALARVCLADLADVQLLPGTIADLPCPQIQVRCDAPVLACLGSQYAGWSLSVGNFFGIGSGPMRAVRGTEAIYDHIPGREKAPVAVGVLEASQLPGPEVAAHIAEQVQLPVEQITLLVARSASLCGTMQVVARVLETALHKLEVLGFDLNQIQSGYGTAPLPPVARKDLPAMGRMNDAILYGGEVVLWVRGDDAVLAEIGPKIPSSASAEHGIPFVEIFQRAGQDFYKIDKMLFSPARISLQNLSSGRTFTFGKLEPDILRRSFFE